MHPNPAFHRADRALCETLIDEIGFGVVFAATPAGPRAAHTPLVSTKDGAVRFHLAKANALARHLAGARALAVVNGPDHYVSPRWYEDRATVPTWNYVALELEGPVRAMEAEGLEALLEDIGERGEGRLAAGERWTRADTPPADWDAMFGAIRGFELEIAEWRPTLKLSQNKPEATREGIADGLEREGAHGLAALMRGLA